MRQVSNTNFIIAVKRAPQHQNVAIYDEDPKGLNL